MKKSAIKLLIPILLLGIIAIGLTITYLKVNKAQPIIIQGEVNAHRVDVSSRVQGRASALYFDVGDKVKKDQIMAVLESAPLQDQLATAEAELAVAIASKNNVYSIRPEIIEARKAALDEAKANLQLAKDNYTRISVLSKKNALSKQEYDTALANYKVAQKSVAAAQANLALAINGNSIEEKKLADAQVKKAKAALDQIQTSVNELHVIAPISGSVTSRVAEPGQLYNPNTPLFSVLSTDDMWFTFNIREDFLHGMKDGDTLNVIIPALNNMEVTLQVTTINELGSYANWQATKATGDFNLRTFELRAKPIDGPIEGLRAGMSAIYTVSK